MRVSSLCCYLETAKHHACSGQYKKGIASISRISRYIHSFIALHYINQMNLVGVVCLSVKGGGQKGKKTHLSGRGKLTSAATPQGSLQVILVVIDPIEKPE